MTAGGRPERQPRTRTGSRTGRRNGSASAAPPRAADAHDAWKRGQAALAAGDLEAATRWLDRARRLVPTDEPVRLALAAALLAQDPARAASLFAGAPPSPEAAFGLVSARLRCGDPDGAAAALGDALSRYVLPPGLEAVADAVARAAGLAGWCGIAGDRLAVAPPTPSAAVEAAFDEAVMPVPGTGPRRFWPLPAAAQAARRLTVRTGGRALLGSPIDLAALRRVEGCVTWARGGGIAGWAWHPAAPDRIPVLTVRPVSGGAALAVRAVAPAAGPGEGMRRARRFALSGASVGQLGGGALRVTGPDGLDLLGSPIDPDWTPSAASSPHGRAPSGPKPRQRRIARPAAVIVPVRDGGAAVRACLDSVLATVPADTPVVVVDDGSRASEVVALLDRLAASARIRLVRHPASRGFPAAANAGLRAAGATRDAVLLNSDTVVPPGWLDRLASAAHAAPDTGTATPLSNNATILSYPAPGGAAPMPDRRASARLDALARRANAGVTVEIPTGIGFCLYIRRDCLDDVGPLRAEVFAQGYGEENDFCMRARARGWRHVAVPGVFVAHRGGASFGAAAAADLARRNAAVLRRLHPDYDALVAASLASDPLHEARRRIDALRWRAGAGKGARAAVLVAHDQGGGVEGHLRARCAALAAEGVRPVVLRPAPDGAVVVGDGPDGGFPNLRFAMPDGLAALAGLLASDRPGAVEFHHMLGHHPALLGLPARLGVPYEVTVHDYQWFCPRVNLLGGMRRYCGEPDLAGCAACVAANGSAFGEHIPVKAFVARADAFLRGAAAVRAPSADAATRMRRHFPGLPVAVAPPPAAAAAPRRSAPAVSRAREAAITVCVVGAIGAAKGYDVLRAAAEDAALRRLPLRFVVVGFTDDDGALMDAGPVFVTGRHAPGEAATLIAAQRADLALLPSVVPETWCFALDECWAAGIDVLAFDLGAQAERIRRAGRGWLVPLGLPPHALNDALLAAARRTRQEWTRIHATMD